eukprot:Gregarina_sp_Pseudo_9__5812@NODE_880_length_2104_cov_82_849395_g826_i0_p1_GENE_NODE_880_length_2104_cov_82_849395_g826_i0NODE_880_length_2104_cov_82_849395_g826_i0_p1_ORF_typecomplete_len356_score52_06Kelch_6/PF13964_6/5_9e05Kelch_6/PF13964_6/2_2e06Kelch_6/PF13964_6/0_00034Kelch_4/PF13418_6/0_00014Kelch_4/PF13418_6/5e07Kelch_4/PF13418_6/0_0026Kelch_5/PF13854_6/0_011Kelch_5/PF13854_6/2_9e05Kelch_5/PF13854_6/2_4e06Kelch_1/PF01344_25/6_2e06Kelch_1/PF01344_25/0_012Kelch_1/PF01344_25/0_0083Kelch_2/PF
MSKEGMAANTDAASLRLRQFIRQPLPADAIEWQLKSRQLLIPAPSVEPRRSKSVTASQASQSDDIIEWAQSSLQTKTTDKGRSVPVCRERADKEVFVARWLNCDISFPLSSLTQERQRRSSDGQHGKRKKQLELGELLRLARVQQTPPVSTQTPPVESVTDEVTHTGPATTRSLSADLRSAGSGLRDRQAPAVSRLERLMPVGGTTKILCHASAFVDPYTYVFGGLTQHGCSDSLWSLDPFEGGWRRVAEKAPRLHGGRVAGEAAPTQRPCRRYNHTVIGWRHYLVVYGGDGAPGYLDDLWYFDTLCGVWDRISLLKEQKSTRPGSRAGHSAALWENQMIVFGGWRGSDGFCDSL